MTNGFVRLMSIIGTVAITVTLILFYLLIPERATLDWLSLSFLLAAEIIFFVGTILIHVQDGRSGVTVLRAGGQAVLAVGATLMAIVSLLFLSVLSSGEAKHFLAVQTVLLASIVISILVMAARSATMQDHLTLQSVSRMRGLIDKVTLLQEDANNAAYAPLLYSVSEALRYTDVSTTVTTDDVIAQKLMELEQVLRSSSKTKDEKISQLVEAILLAIKTRSAEVRTNKVGGI